MKLTFDSIFTIPQGQLTREQNIAVVCVGKLLEMSVQVEQRQAFPWGAW